MYTGAGSTPDMSTDALPMRSQPSIDGEPPLAGTLASRPTTIPSRSTSRRSFSTFTPLPFLTEIDYAGAIGISNILGKQSVSI